MTSLLPLRLRPVHLAAIAVAAALAACGGGGDSGPSATSSGASPVTTSGGRSVALVGSTFKGLVNGAHNTPSGDVHTSTGSFQVTVNDDSGATTGTTQINGLVYPVAGRVAFDTMQVTLTVSPSPGGPADAGGTITGKVLDQTGLWGMAANFELRLPWQGQATTERHVGSVSADTSAAGAGATTQPPSGGGGGGGSGGSLVGAWEYAAGGQRAVEILSGTDAGGTGRARTWSGAVDGYYIEYTWSVSGSTKQTAVTRYLACDFNQGRWLEQPQRPTGSITFTLTGNTVVYSNAPNTPYTRSSSASISTPTAGGSCSRI
jgi:hypothetical protein